ncbi:hypothetical protein A3C37_04470 [Candidatus Peribacteria bacterium RIFCSPHIGHO2_02_FULL_53_20]|nr:MAG: hypothetical protein A3C37_04470 [Candidatus Peribacteria bacterium RIFCSPHIGHO2_02_FULL_53_20]OGJ67050.1 MAG: hypothetical protein A3B61_04010 [Candidatus Peribacteria bacterium RIFCSPLOWO2_01_FULL_53_10]
MPENDPSSDDAEKVAAISDGTAKPLLTPTANLDRIYANVRAPGASTDYQIYDLLLRRIENKEPVDWENVAQEVTGLKADRQWYNAILTRMLEKQWIDVPQQLRTSGKPMVNALALEILNGECDAQIAEKCRDIWRERTAEMTDQTLKSTCAWYMEQLEENRPHTSDDWIRYLDPYKRLSSEAADTAKQKLLQAIEHLETNGFIVEMDATPLANDDFDLDKIGTEVTASKRISDGVQRLETSNAQTLAETIDRYAQDIITNPIKRNARTVQHELLRRVQNNESTAWADIYAAIQNRLNAKTMDEYEAHQVYLDAVDTNLHRNIIRKAQ